MLKRLGGSVWRARSGTVLAASWLAIAALGCKSSAGTAGSGTPSYAATVGGVPVEFRSVFAVSTGGATLRLVLTNQLTSCDQVRALVQGGAVAVVPHAHDLEMLLAPTFEKDGRRTWKVSRVSYDNKPGGVTEYDVDAAAVDPTGVVRVTMKQPLVLEASKIFERPNDVPIELPTEIRALGCGVAPRPKDAVPRPQPLLTAKVNGVKVPIRGAVLTKLKPYDLPGAYGLVLSSEPTTCKESLEGDVVIEVQLDAQGTRVTHFYLNGDTTFTGNYQTGAIDGFVAKPHGDIAGTGDVSIDLAGKASLYDKFEVELTGTANAERCP